MKLKSIDPYTEEVLQEYDLLTDDQAAAAVGKSRDAFRLWSELPVRDRTGYVKKLGAQLRAEKRKYAEIMTREMGKPLREALGEVEKCAWLCDYCADNGERFLAPEPVATEAKKSYVVFQPLGVVLAIMPWNFPFWQAFRFGVPAITAGNVVLLKHASNVPGCALLIEDAFRKAGFPEHVFTTLLIDPAQALRLIDEDRVDAVSLTGSNAAGAQVGEHAGRRVKKVVLELGGSDPFIVLDDANVEKAAATAVNARMINTGQSCIAAKRFIVMESAADTFREVFLSRLKALKLGDPMDEATQVGPLAKKELVDSLERQLRDAEEKGAEVVRTAEPPAKGYFFSPCAVFSPKDDMQVMNEEVFGPVAPVRIVRSEDEAVKIANQTEFGLGASVWSGDTERAERVAARIQSGVVAINDMVKSDPRLPFGGIKKSGLGRELSHYGMKEFVNIKTIVVKE